MININDDTDLDYSVLIGRVSTEDSDRILETLKSLHNQAGKPSLEILLADRLDDDISIRIHREYPRVRIIKCCHEMDLPTMRAEALKYASGRFILVTEDHCVPPVDWLQNIAKAFSRYPDADVIGGCVVNGVTDTALDWATFMCEYAHLSPPIKNGPTANIAGLNVAYRREIFEIVEANCLRSGFWETTLHPVLNQKGYLLAADNDVMIFHCKKFSLRLFLRQRFLYSQYFAGIRFPQEKRIQRYFFALISLALPPLLVTRLFRNAIQKTSLNRHLAAATPYLFLFYLVWGIGEAWGYVFGPGEALQEIE